MQSIIIEHQNDSEQRIDKFLRKYLPNSSLWVLYKWLRTGKIKVNKKRVDQKYILATGDVIDLHFHDDEINELKKTTIKTPIHKDVSKIEIIYEDTGLIVINKPAGINVHPGDHKTTEPSVIEIVQDMLWEKYNSLSFKPALVHRIDRETSGILLIAKEKKVLESLLNSLQNGKMTKVYHTLVIGKPPIPRGTIREKLLRKEEAKNEAKVIVSPLWQEAITHYKTLSENIYGSYSLLECQIETGRTHQIRVHMQYSECPILGDKAYGNKWENSFAKKEYGVERQMLHAYSLTFPHPESKKTITLIAPYPADFEKFIIRK